MYLMLCTRPDLCTAVITLSKFTNINNEEIWKNIKKIFKYFRGSSQLKLTYKKWEFKNLISGYAESDWAGESGTNRRSTTGYALKLFENA